MDQLGRRGLLGVAAGMAASLVLGLANAKAQSATILEVAITDGAAPVSNARVQFASASIPQGDQTVTTNELGIARLETDAGGLFDLFVEAAGYAPASLRDVAVGDGQQVSISLVLSTRTTGSY